MFLRNYDNYWAAVHLFSTPQNVSSYGNTAEFGDGFLNQKTTNGAIERVMVASGSGVSGHYLYPPLNWSKAGICLGDGRQPVTYDDFKLSGSVVNVSPLTQHRQTDVYDTETKKRIKTLLFTYYNGTEASISIGEWGLFRGNTPPSSFAYTNSSADEVLMFREVLPEPIVIIPGETATIQFSIEIPTSTI